MSISPRQTVVVLVSLALVASGTVGLAGATTDAAAETQSTADQTTTAFECAAESPSDHSDPQSDVIGWENGTWYDESIDVDQSDGVDESEQRAIVDRTTARVEALRCVEFDEPVGASVISRTEYRERLRSGNLTGVNVTEELRAFDNVKFESLFLVNESTDSIEVQRENQGTAVLGYYDPIAAEIVVVAEDRETLRIDEVTLAHELLHAWQDQRYNLSSEEFAPRVRDQANARNGLIEGDASYVDRLYQRHCEDGAWAGTCHRPVAAAAAEQEELANIGLYFLSFQPYSDGPPFVRLVETVGGWDAVDRLYERPPASTEQVIHVDRYQADDPSMPEFTDRTTDDWERVRPPNRPDYASVGESGLMSTFIYPFYHSDGRDQIVPRDEWLNFDEDGNVSSFDSIDYRSNYTEGWDGDRLHVYENETNATAYVWQIEWDSPQDALQFVTGYHRVLEYWGAEQVGLQTVRIADGEFDGAYHVAVDGTTVTIVHAPTEEQLTEVRTDVVTGTTDE